MTPATWTKLRLRQVVPGLSRTALVSADLHWAPVPDESGPGGCGLHGAIRLSGGAVAFSPSSFPASCPLAVDWAMFEAHVLQPEAGRRFGQPVARVGHLGSRACRNARGGTQPSAHANALDVADITLRDGRRIEEADWSIRGRPAVSRTCCTLAPAGSSAWYCRRTTTATMPDTSTGRRRASASAAEASAPGQPDVMRGPHPAAATGVVSAPAGHGGDRDEQSTFQARRRVRH